MPGRSQGDSGHGEHAPKPWLDSAHQDIGHTLEPPARWSVTGRERRPEAPVGSGPLRASLGSNGDQGDSAPAFVRGGLSLADVTSLAARAKAMRRGLL